MAKVSEFKFDLNKVSYKISVNVTSDGIFKAILPADVSKALAIHPAELKFSTLSELSKEFYSALDRYKKAETSQYLHIAIQYSATRDYTYYDNGNAMFGQMNSKYYGSSNYDSIASIGFDFDVVMLEITDKVEKWYGTYERTPGVYEQGNSFSISPKNMKIIPFDENCLATLLQARKNLRKISEMLFNFIEQDQMQITNSLQNNKLFLNQNP